MKLFINFRLRKDSKLNSFYVLVHYLAAFWRPGKQLQERVSLSGTTLAHLPFLCIGRDGETTHSAGRHHVLGKMLYSLGNIFNMRFKFLARRSFRQISFIPGKWLIFCQQTRHNEVGWFLALRSHQLHRVTSGQHTNKTTVEVLLC